MLNQLTRFILFLLIQAIQWLLSIQSLLVLEMQKKHKAFIAFALIGVVCIFIMPKYGCDTANFYCPLLPYIGYASFGICGLILAFELLRLLKKCLWWLKDCCCNCCECCCQFIFKRRQQNMSQRSYSIMRGSLLDQHLIVPSIHNAPIEELSHGSQIPAFYQYQQMHQQEEGIQGFRQTFNQQQCTICLQPFSSNEQIVRIKCGHKYHELCISDWLMKNQKCPNCRDNVF